jgi:hypothetical protein
VTALADQFRQSEDLVEEVVDEALPQDAPIDASHPGFASLLTVLRGARDNAVDLSVVQTYHEALHNQVQDTRVQLSEMEIHEDIREHAAPMVAAMNGLMDNLEQVLGFTEIWIESDDAESLDKAIALLEGIHTEVRAIF